MLFSQQHVIISGGSSGIGRELGRLFLQAGGHLSLIARTPSKLLQVQEEFHATKPTPSQEILTYSADVSDYSQVSAALAAAIAHLGPPQILITCAGLSHPDYFDNLSLDVFERMMAVNYFGSLYCIKAALPAMQARGKGQIVLISSGAGLMGIYGYSAYSPSKFAVRGLAESLRPELKQFGIDVAIVYGGDTDTPQLAQENLTKPPATKAITSMGKVQTAAAVAEAIFQGIRKKTFLITPSPEMTFLARCHSLLFPWINRYLDRVISENTL